MRHQFDIGVLRGLAARFLNLLEFPSRLHMR